MEEDEYSGLALRDLIVAVETARYQAHVTEVEAILSEYAAQWENQFRGSQPCLPSKYFTIDATR